MFFRKFIWSLILNFWRVPPSQPWWSKTKLFIIQAERMVSWPNYTLIFQKVFKDISYSSIQELYSMIFLKILGTKTKFSQPLTNCGTHHSGSKMEHYFPPLFMCRQRSAPMHDWVQKSLLRSSGHQSHSKKMHFFQILVHCVIYGHTLSQCSKKVPHYQVWQTSCMLSSRPQSKGLIETTRKLPHQCPYRDL